MKDTKHFKSNTTDKYNFYNSEPEPKKYPTVNLDGSYYYSCPEQNSNVNEIDELNHKPNNIFWTIFSAILFISLFCGLLFVSYYFPKAQINRFNLYRADQSNRQADVKQLQTITASHVIVNKIGEPFGCSFFMKQNKADGLFIEEIIKDGPADQAGLLVSDQILFLDDKKIQTIGDVVNFYDQKETGDAVKVIFVRDGAELETIIILDQHGD
ncbi:MAG: PDZ domain-containing protein [Clostridiaceae bacterium]|nr:PDZ domain-containing protein [Clostridiaceae bacterium]